MSIMIGSDVSNFFWWSHGVRATARGLSIACAAALLAACGADASGAPEPRNEQPKDEEPLPPDPLDLASCTEPVGVLAESVDLPDLGWDDGGDDHAAYCAFRALDAAIEGKKILCLGENDHGVSETTRWDAALVRYLVHHAGVRTIAYESDFASMEAWNRYLVTGDVADLEAGFEMLESTLASSMEAESFVESLRAVQAELPEGERLRYTGFDIAVQPYQTIDALVGFLEAVAPDEVTEWISRWNARPFSAAADAAAQLLEQLDANRDAYVAATGEAAWSAARINAANLRDGFDFLEYYTQGDFSTGNAAYREPGMIRNVEAFAAALPEGERMLLISHNLHCAKNLPAQGARTVSESPAVGTYLARSETWGPQYFLLAQLYEHGQHRSLRQEGLVTGDFDSADGTLPDALQTRSNAPALLIGTDATEPPMDDRWNVAPFGTNVRYVVPAEQFDALLWVREVAATTAR